MARTGEAYLQGLRDKRDVWLGAERVQDVTTHPALAGACRKMAEYYDLHHAAASVCLVPNPQTAEPMSVSHLIPRSRADLAKRHLQGANDLDAATRSHIFRTAWDFAGSALGSRVELYERFYLASSSRTYQLAHMTAQKDGMRGLLDRFLATES